MPEAPDPWLAVFGRAHLLLLHAPLGLVPALALLEFGAAALRRPPPRGPILALAWFAALAAAAAAVSGIVLAGSGDYHGDTVDRHKLAGIALGALCAIAAVLALFANRTPFRLSLLAALGVMVPTGHLGGVLTHGRDFLLAPLRPKAVAAAPTPAAEPAAAGDPAVAGANDPAAADGDATAGGEFARVIAPLLERTCNGCHNPDKQKGELLLTTRAGIERGGENGPVLVPGKPDESPLLTRCELPLDHDDHMPPAEKPQPTAAELQALRSWIAAGAPF